NTLAPSIGGTAQQGQTLSASNGSWSNEPTSYSYSWQRCDSAEANCVAIPAATAQTYTASAEDVGHTLRVSVTATNSGGSSAPATSKASSQVLPLAPANTLAPSIGGTAQQGQTLSASNGSWSNEPTSYSYSWQRCDSAEANCMAIPAATAQTYTASAEDVGHTLRVSVTATNSGGSSAPATSKASSQVLPLAPANTLAPSIGGTAQQGQTLSA